MGLKNVESRSQRLQETLLTLRRMSAEELLRRQKGMNVRINRCGGDVDSPSPNLRDELRLIEEEIQRRHAKETH